MSLSRRHHYIPEFMLKGFADEQKTLAVYDLETRRLWKNRASPKQIFFEYDRNTFDVHGNKADFIEEIYKKIDTDFAIVYQRLMKGDYYQYITDDDFVHVILFIGMMYWRLPDNDGKINALMA